MSRTYRKYLRLGVCCGSNTEWYRERRREQRTKNKHILRKLRKMPIESFTNECEFINYPKRDSWNEPTDGTWLVYKSTIRQWKQNIESDDEYDAWWGNKMYKKCAHQMKSYHQKKWS